MRLDRHHRKVVQLACRALSLLALLVTVPATAAAAQGSARRPLGAAEIDDIARLEMLEDHRQFDSTELARILSSSHPEVRRRAAQSVGRINDKRGIALLRAQPLDRDTSVAATVVWSIGQMRDSSTVPWLDSMLTSRTPPTVAGEAAIALGKIKTASAREVLARFLARGDPGSLDTPAVREALLSIGRSTARGDNTSIVRWTSSKSAEIRWRATWSLFRPKDPAGVSTLLVMSKDPSPVIRSWAVRGLTKPQADSAKLGDAAERQLLAAIRDVDRTVRTEAIRALGFYSDSAAVKALVTALDSPDSWISVSAAEGLGRIHGTASIPRLMTAGRNRASCALRVTAMNSLQMFSPNDAITLAIEMTRDTVPYCRATAAASLVRSTGGGRGAVDLSSTVRAYIDTALVAYRAARRRELFVPDVPVRVAAIRAVGTSGDTTDLAALNDIRAKADTLSAVAITSAASIAAIQRRANGAPAGGRGAGGGGGGGGGGGARPAPPVGTQPLEFYRQIVEKWVVPDYNGRPRPTARIDTPRGPVVVELYPGDAPLATDDFVHTVAAGSMIGTEFTRVVPDFVDQQQTIRSGNTLRDEVNRHGLTRANLAWATSGLDTGSPGYTLGHTPQPHNEGDFTSLGGVIRGMAAADRIELGDRIIGAVMLTGGATRP
jgi:HEAT repeat protein/cyclophilin family peptidyl-prolyl cis-trans isomerase